MINKIRRWFSKWLHWWFYHKKYMKPGNVFFDPFREEIIVLRGISTDQIDIEFGEKMWVFDYAWADGGVFHSAYLKINDTGLKDDLDSGDLRRATKEDIEKYGHENTIGTAKIVPG